MKNSDIAMVILISAVSVIAAYFLGNFILGDPNEKVEEIKYIDMISDSIDMPTSENFNPTAYNPTVEVYVGDCGALEKWNTEERRCVPVKGSSDDAKSGSVTVEDNANTGVKTDDTTDNDDTVNDDNGAEAQAGAE